MRIQDALRKSQELGLDLVEVAPNAQPPVCRIVDFGKFKYELSKHDKEKKSNAASKMKEIKFRVNIGAHDYETKLRHAEEFLDKGNKVRMLLQFRGREMAHQELGMGLMGKIRKDIENMGAPEAEPKLIGRNVFMTVVPLPPGKRKRRFFGPHDMALVDEPEEGDEEEDEEEFEEKKTEQAGQG